MLDIRQFREQPELIKAAIAKRGGDIEDVERVRGLDERLRAMKTEAEAKKAELNAATKQMGAQMKTLSVEEKDTRRAELRAVGDAISGMDALRADVEKTLHTLLLEIPNIPRDDVPVGADEHSNIVTRSEGDLKTFDFTPKPHWELGANLGILDIERGIKISGSRFYVLKGMGAALQRALIAYMLDLHIQKHGYEEIYPPFVVKQECLYGTTQLPKFADNLYHDVEDDFWMVPTAEVPVTNLHRDEILDAAQLPVCYVAYTPCFRREKMSSGRDVRGIKRGHQFDKVEMVKLTTPQTSDSELLKLLDNAEDVCRGLGLPHRIVLQSTGDLSFGSACHVRRGDTRSGQQGRGGGRVAGGVVVQQLPRLSGPSHQCALSSRSPGQAGIRAYAQRVGLGPASRPNRRFGKLPERGRQRHDSACPAPLPAQPRTYHPGLNIETGAEQ